MNGSTCQIKCIRHSETLCLEPSIYRIYGSVTLKGKRRELLQLFGVCYINSIASSLVMIFVKIKSPCFIPFIDLNHIAACWC